MEYMFQAGFLGTRAPFFMDIIVIIVALLPFLIAFTVWFAVNGMFKLHRFLQTVLFLITVIVLVYFEYGMHLAGGFEHYIKDSSINPSMAFYFLVLHIIIASITMIIWFFTIRFASGDSKRRALPGLYSGSHKQSGRRVSIAILLTSLTGLGVYWMLFMA